MLRLLDSLIFGRKLDRAPAAIALLATEALVKHLHHEAQEPDQPTTQSRILSTIGWLSAGMGAVAVGLFVGRELRQRYKFNRRTPYDFYAHSGDELQDIEFGLGI